MKPVCTASLLSCALAASAGARPDIFERFSGPLGSGGFNNRQILWQTLTGNGYIESEGANYVMELYGTMQFEVNRGNPAIFPQTGVGLWAREFVTTGATTVRFIGMNGDATVPVQMNGDYVYIDSFPYTLIIGDIIRVELFSPSYARFDNIVISVDCQNNGATTDMDGDSFLTGSDYDQFILFFEFGDLRDFDRDGFLTGLDFDSYIFAFEQGCP